jgi:hypothetical protein
MKINWIINRHDAREKKLRMRYCRHGYHKLTRAVLTHHPASGKEIKIEYLNCAHCNWRFFANIKEKEKYMKVKKKESGIWRTLYQSD